MLSDLEFVQDKPRAIARSELIADGVTIAGVILEQLRPNSDDRGELTELLTTRDNSIEPIVHVYQVTAVPGSFRGLVYHKWQFDRLHFALGELEVGLIDIRRDSPTSGRRMVMHLGGALKARLTIPPFVAHSVRNRSDVAASFINMPTRCYDPANPDKFRCQGDLSKFLNG